MNEELQLKPTEKLCPMCKKAIDKQASKCPYCQSDLSVAGNLAKILWSVGVILIVFVTIPVLLFSCGMCSLG